MAANTARDPSGCFTAQMSSRNATMRSDDDESFAEDDQLKIRLTWRSGPYRFKVQRKVHDVILQEQERSGFTKLSVCFQ